MTPIEAAQLIAMIRSVNINQQFDEHAPEAWSFVLDDVSLGDAKAALRNLARERRFLDPCDFVAEVKRLRSDRINACGITAGDVNEITGDNPRHWQQEIRELRARAADGTLDRDGYLAYLDAGAPITPAPAAITAAPARKPRSSGPGCSCEPCYTRRHDHACSPDCPCRRDCIQIANPPGMPDGWANTLKRTA